MLSQSFGKGVILLFLVRLIVECALLLPLMKVGRKQVVYHCIVVQYAVHVGAKASFTHCATVRIAIV